MQPDPTRDAISAICNVYASDPGGGLPIEVLQKGCLFVSLTGEKWKNQIVPRRMGLSAKIITEEVKDERSLL